MADLLRIEGLSVSYRDRERTVRALGGVDLTLRAGQILGIVGESGCGKSTLAHSVLQLLPANGRIDAGGVFFEGADLTRIAGESLRSVRGRRIAMIFQDPVSGLNPVLTIGRQVEEMIRTHVRVSKREAREMALDALRAQGLPDAPRVAEAYPYQLSGGMCQRVMIAIATVMQPAIIIADEPTSALDVTMQAAILQELRDLRARTGMAVLLITHDLGVIANIADDVAVMYAGRIVEEASVGELFARPRHPYTAALMAARPRLDDPGRKLAPIHGAPPDLSELTGKCAFLDRCAKAVSQCRTELWPDLERTSENQRVACFNPMYVGA